MLKFTVDTLDGLDETTAALYEPADDGFKLKVEGLPKTEDVSGLKAKVEELLGEKKRAEAERKEAEKLRKKAEEDKAQKAGDYEALSKTYKTELDQLKAQLQERDIAQAKSELQREAMSIASELADGSDQKILSRFVADRLRYEDGAVKVTDANGNLTELTTAELAAEMKADPQFSSLVVGSRASGSGAAGAQGGGAAPQKGDFGGSREERKAAIANRFPDLKTGT